jgi:hypothetical protein
MNCPQFMLFFTNEPNPIENNTFCSYPSTNYYCMNTE